MKDIVKYIFHEVQSRRLPKTDAIDLISQLQTQIISDRSCFLHPLLQQNTSDFSEQRFSSTFTGQEFFLADHIVKGQRVLPGVAYLEMARAAVQQAAGALKEGNNQQIQFKNIVWSRPIVIEKHPVQVNIGLYPEDNGDIAYEIYSGSEDINAEPIVYSRGSAVLSSGFEIPVLDLKALQTQCSQSSLSSSECYEIYSEMGIDYGPGHQGIEKVYVGLGQVLAKLYLPSVVSETRDQFILHPSLMDSALQASIGLIMGSSTPLLSLPFALQELKVFSKCTCAMWALIRYSNGSKAGDKVQKLDIDLCDEIGNICVQMKGFSSRVLEGEVGSVGSSVAETVGMLRLTPLWKQQDAQGENMASDYADHVVILCEPKKEIQESIETAMKGIHCFTLKSEHSGIDQRFQTYAVQVFEKIQSIIKGKTTGKVLVQIVVSTENEQQLFLAFSGLLKTAQLENKNLIGQLIGLDGWKDSKGIIEKLTENSRSKATQIQYQKGKRQVMTWSEIGVSDKEVSVPWKDQGIYLITGGVGGLGIIFARDIAHKVKNATIILTGRSPLSEEKQEKLKELESLGIRTEYKQVDVIQKKAVADLIKDIQKKFGSLNGIIHAAGVNRDNFIIKKTKDELLEVLAPKVTGLVNLDLASKDLSLDFFVLFSSIAGSLGNLGQIDYSAANAFMDAYAKYRNDLVVANQRQGQTLSINWPLWKDGGMHVDEETEKMMLQNTGMMVMQASTGIGVLYEGLASGKDQIMMVEGKLERMKEKLLSNQQSKAPVAAASSMEIDTSNMLDKVQETLMQAVSNLIKVNIGDLDVDAELSEYGFDSIMFTEFTNKLNQEYTLELTPTIFFEYPTLCSFARYLVEQHQNVLAPYFIVQTKVEAPIQTIASIGIDTSNMLDKVQEALMQAVSNLIKVNIGDLDVDAELSEYGFDSIMFTEFTNKLNQEYTLELTPTIFFEYPTLCSFARYLVEQHQDVLAPHFVVQTKVETSIQPIEDKKEEVSSNKRQHSRFVRTMAVSAEKSIANNSEPIAIVGMSGIFPMAKDVNELWTNLVEGKDCITEIPKSRWDWQEYYGDPKKEANKSNVKWGGFIDGIDEFDPLFFGISPREAELMDPQQRLLMIHAWKVIEDAGYSAQSLSGTKTGMFVGTMSTGYNQLIAEANVAIEGYSSTGMVPSVGPNRMSYFLNIHGPSEPVETACSSALVAIHRAVSAIENGSCEMALVGGVNTLVTPELQISFNKAGMLCEDGRCKTFSNKANGYVRGEGAGMIFLKKLKDAEQAGDHIYGVIRGSAENHGGRANSLTAPNPKAQAEVLKAAYTKAGIDPRTVTYIEAHGTGTELGDPIEINGLKAAFKDLYQATGDSQVVSSHCGVGSVKTNIGHLEMAAGIAGVIKVLLQLKHKTLVKTLHCDTINPYIQLKDSPFYIVQETKEWKTVQDERGNDIPRRAGVSSFGFGGANAHVIIEEYIPKNQEQPQGSLANGNPVIIVLSAKNEGQLKEQARQLLSGIQKQQFSDASLADVAYTLQVGREAMEERLAIIVGSVKELEEKLKGFINGQNGIPDLYGGGVKRNKDTIAILAADEDMPKIIDAWIAKGKFKKLLDMWVKGLNFDWNKLYGDIKPSRLGLPTYPFAKEHYWVPKNRSKLGRSNAVATIHPLLQQNTSDFSAYRFSSTFTGQEFFLTNYEVENQRVLSEVSYLEMARAAVSQAMGDLQLGETKIWLKNVVWSKPIVVVDQPIQIHIELYPEEDGDIAYEIYSKSEKNDAEPVIHSQGIAVLGSSSEIRGLNISDLQAQCSYGNLSSSQCYESYSQMGIDYSSGQRGIEKVYVGSDKVLAKLYLPSAILDTQDQFVLHPSLMDSALQASIGLMMGSDNPKLSVPFALQELEIFSKLTSEMWALIRYSNGSEARNKVQKLTIDLCDETGNVCVQMKGLSTRILKSKVYNYSNIS